MLHTRSSQFWETQPGNADVLNCRLTFPSTNDYGIPDLPATQALPTSLAAWHNARQRDYAGSTGGALHFFLDDYRFENAWHSPERLLPRVTAVGMALTPDFSLWADMPRAAQIWNVYRSRWLGAFWASHGVTVIPTISWGSETTFRFCLAGAPRHSVLALSSLGVRPRDADAFAAGVQHVIDALSPTMFLAYGKLRHCESLELPPVVEYPTHWDRRSKTWAEDQKVVDLDS